MGNSTGLTNLQIELVKMFKYDLGESQLNEIKDILSGYFAQKATKEMDEFFEEENLNEETIEKWSKEHLRRKDRDEGRT